MVFKKRIKKLFTVPEGIPYGQWHELDENADMRKKKYPVRWFFFEVVPKFFKRRWNQYISEPWYKLKCRVWYKYNV